MFEIFVGMEVEVTVREAMQQQAIVYKGTLLESDDNRIVMDVTSYKNATLLRMSLVEGNLQGKMIINNRYIISMFAAVN